MNIFRNTEKRKRITQKVQKQIAVNYYETVGNISKKMSYNIVQEK